MIEKGICMADGKTGAIILAAGRSAHMEELKPMLRMGQTTMIQREIDTIRQAGISPIVVVTGYQADVLERHISHRGAVCIRNKRYETSQMYGSICMGLRHIQKKERWGWLLFSGIVGILTGVVVLVAPWVATIVLASFLWASVGFWAIFTGVLEISAAVRLRREIKGEIWLALSGLLSIILGAIVLWIFFTRPVESFVAAGWLLGFHAAVYGVTLLFLSWSLRKTRLG